MNTDGRRRIRPAMRSRQVAVVVVCLSLSATGCASRLPRSEIIAAQGTGVATAPVSATDQGDTSGALSRPAAAVGADVTAAAGAAGSTPKSENLERPAGVDVSNTRRSAGSAGAGAVSAAVPANGIPIKIGSVGSISGLFGGVLKPILEGIQVNIAAINRDGGVNGHPIELVVADDNGDPAVHLSRLRQLLEKDEVIGFVNMPAATLSKASLDYHESKSVPYIDTDGSNTLAGSSPMSFTMGSSAAALNGAEFSAVSTLAGAGPKVGYIVCLEVQQCADYADSFAGFAKRAGLTPVYGAKATLTSPDFTQNCLQARSAGAEFIFIRADPNSIKRIARDCSRQGYLPRFVFAGGTTDATFPGTAALNGAIIPSQVFPFTASDTPEAKRFKAEMIRTRVADQIIAGNALGWVAANVLVKALGQVGPADTPTTAALLKGLWTFKNERLGGLSLPLTYSQGAPPTHATRSCSFPMTLANGGWVAPKGNAFFCLPA